MSMPTNEVGTVSECWRYPVKSLQGHRLDHVDISPAGIDGDRSWALIDEDTGALLSAKRVAALLQASVEADAIVLPSGEPVSFDDPDASVALSKWLGRPVRLATPVAGQQLAYQMTFDPPDDTAEYFDIPAPVGSFLDLAPVHLLTTATLTGCRDRRPDLDWDVRRFRPNLLLDVAGDPFIENGWVGARLRVGEQVVLEIRQPTVRCAMPLRAQPGLDREPGLFRAMNELNESMPNHFGVYVDVVTAGSAAVGDRVVLEPLTA